MVETGPPKPQFAPHSKAQCAALEIYDTTRSELAGVPPFKPSSALRGEDCIERLRRRAVKPGIPISYKGAQGTSLVEGFRNLVVIARPVMNDDPLVAWTLHSLPVLHLMGSLFLE